MKLLFILIVLFISSVSSTQFANFQGPFLGESEFTCSKSIAGASFSVAINKCMINIGGFNDPVQFVGNAFNWFLQVNNDQLEISQYAHNETTCLYGLEQSTNLTINECSQVPDFQQVQSSYFAQLSITNKPTSTPGTLTISQFNPQNFNCNVDNLLWSVSFTNGFELDTSNAGSTSSTTFICKNGKPYFNNCFNGKCLAVEMDSSCSAANLQTITCQ